MLIENRKESLFDLHFFFSLFLLHLHLRNTTVCDWYLKTELAVELTIIKAYFKLINICADLICRLIHFQKRRRGENKIN